MATARQWITRAYRLLGVVGQGRAPSAPEAVDGLEALNTMLAGLRGRVIGQRLTRQFSASSGDTAIAGGLYAVAVTTPSEPDAGDRIGVTASVTVTAGSGTIEGAASVAGVEGDSWFYRPDTDNWVAEDVLTLDSASPFSPELDEVIPFMLAARLAPEFGIELSSTISAGKSLGMTRFRQAYGSTPVIAVEKPLLRTLGRC
jgi:hypothetical protein